MSVIRLRFVLHMALVNVGVGGEGACAWGSSGKEPGRLAGKWCVAGPIG